MLATTRKEQLQAEIERQQDMGIGEDWEQEDRYLAEVNLDDLESLLATCYPHSKGGKKTSRYSENRS